MAQATFHFPRGFLWGTATSSHQVEGNNFNNNWWAWEQQPGRIREGHRSGAACDWWGGRWRDDLDRAVEAGQNAHRFSLEWSRIQPTPDKWDEASLDRYREMARWMHAHGVTPLVTLHHFTDPLWAAEKGGWENEAIVGLFERFARKAVDALKEYVNLWVTINEPNVLAFSAYLDGAWPPGKKDMSAALRVTINQVKAHAAAYHAIHAEQSQARVGIAHHRRPIVPARSWFPPDRVVAGVQNGLFNDLFARAAHDGKLRLPGRTVKVAQAAGTQDFIGLNYYTQDTARFDLRSPGEAFGLRALPAGAELSEGGFLANVPQGLFDTIQWALQFERPIIITENGVEDSQDTLRPRYLAQHLHQVWRAANFNYPVKGYFHWSLVDNFEWERGWTQRFGLWELDVDTQARRKRPSADLYAEICKENGISSEMVARYAPRLFESMFPN
jgi:beta-glucosidase